MIYVIAIMAVMTFKEKQVKNHLNQLSLVYR